MPLVNVMVNGRSYTIACDEGEEDHLRELGEFVDKRVRELVETVGQVGDARLLLMASLLVADELAEAVHRLEERDREVGELKGTRVEVAEKFQSAEGAVANMLEAAARRVEDIAARIEQA